MNVAELLAQAARRVPDAPAVTCAGTTLTYAAFDARVAGLARSLREEAALERGARVGLAVENSLEFLIALFAIWRAGLAAVPMNAKLHGREMADMLADCGATLCFASPKQASAIAEAGPDCPLVDVAGTRFSAWQEARPLAVTPARPEDLAWLFYTSGTTGRPKGAMLSHRNLIFAVHTYFSDIDPADDGDTMLHAAPLSHGSGLYALPHVARGNHQLVLSGSFDPDAVIAVLATHQNVSMFAAPTMVTRLVAAVERTRPDLSNLKTVIYGGGPMYVADLKRAYAALDGKLYQLFGQGESPMTITGLDQRYHAQAMREGRDDWLGSCGFARTGVEVGVFDANDRPLPPGEFGEVVTRSDCVMSGYWGNEEASRETLRGGWLHTGDIGAMGADGLLTLHDRSKDMIISGGTNIYPREVEEVLLTHPAVREVAVLGRADADWGETVVACVALNQEGVSAADLDAHCLARLARFKRPRDYIFLPDLPKNSYGKILKRELRASLGEEKAAG